MKKMNRKGFTLIELLVVIAVLSLVLSISIYFISTALNRARQKTYATTINEVEKAAVNYLLENSDDLFFTKYEDIEYQCVTVKDLIDYSFLNNDVTKSKINDDGDTIGINNYIYIERNTSTKAIQKNVYIADTLNGYSDICSASVNAEGRIYFKIEPKAWSKEKNVNIKYELKNVSNRSNYEYGYEYTDDNNIIDGYSYRKDNNSSKDVAIYQKGIMYADILYNDNGTTTKIIDKTQSIEKFDHTGPIISLVNDDERYVKNSVTIPLSIKDCNDNNCSGLNEDILDSNKLKDIVDNNIIVKVGENIIDSNNITLTKSSTGIYDLEINNDNYDGKVSIKILENTFVDKVVDEVKNGNVETNLNPKIYFDNTKPIVTSETTTELLKSYQTLTLKCSDDSGIIGYYIGTTQPNNSTTYTKVDSLKEFETTKRIDSAATYYVSCKDKAENTKTDTVKYWNYTLKYMLAKTDGIENTYSTNNYSEVDSSSYLISNGVNIDFNNIDKTVPNGSNSNKYKGVSSGTPGTSAATLLTNNPNVTGNATYALWYNRNIVKLQFNVNSGQLASEHGAAYSEDSEGYILKNGSRTVQSVKYGATMATSGLINWNNSKYVNIEREGYSAKSGEEWILRGGSTTYNQATQYNSSDFCDASSKDCTITLNANWIDSEGPVIEFAMYNGNTKLNNNSGIYYASSNSSSLSWFNFSPTLWFKVTDNDSGVNKNVTMDYNDVGLSEAKFNTNKKGTISRELDNNGEVSYTIGSDGYRYIKFHACDNLGNCTDKKVYFKFDNTAPTMNFEMLNGTTVVHHTNSKENYYISNSEIKSDSVTNWLSFYPVLRYITTDSISGINKDSNTIGYNRPGQIEYYPDFVSENRTIDNITFNDNAYYFDLAINGNGNRHIKFKICDNAGNCTTNYLQFKVNEVVNAIRYNCDLYSDNKFRLGVFNVTSCVNSSCNYNKLNGLDNSYSFNMDVNNPISWRIASDEISDSLDDTCLVDLYIKSGKTIDCYNGVNTSSGKKTTITADCTKISAYRTTMKINNDGSSWYYVNGNQCYIQESNLTLTRPTSCDSSNTTYHVTFNANGGHWASGAITLSKDYYPTLQLSTITKPTKSGCSFSGWTFNGAPRTSYLDKQENGGVIKAKWNCGSLTPPTFTNCKCISHYDCVRQAGDYDNNTFEIKCTDASNNGVCSWRRIKDTNGKPINGKWNMCF